MFLCLLVICYKSSGHTGELNDEAFGNYWYQGKAEITSYRLNQARYGEIHNGHAVLIFVTEDFSKSKQVKLDIPEYVPDDRLKVLKLNYVKKFDTGIYPYSIMTSIFTPVDINNFPNSLKLTMSTQEWCGNVFTQANLRDNKFNFKNYSYFESERDREFDIENKFLEDEIWNRIRLSPQSLPTGNIKIIPSVVSSRLKHFELKVEDAFASNLTENDRAVYKIKYKDLDREVEIIYNKDFPYEILGWKETYVSGWGNDAKILTTEAVKLKTITLDYWNKNKLADKKVRKLLGL